MARRSFRIGAAFAFWAIAGWGSVQAMTLEEALRIDKGFQLFTTEKFNGNGRTCSTCHLPEKNYTISPADIVFLPAPQADLVFAKKTPGLENAKLVSKFALFNIGPGNANVAFPVGPFRTSMTMAGLDLTVSNCRVPPPFSPVCPGVTADDARTGPQLGWSGDGSPRNPHHGNADLDADGSLRGFTNGAIAQHFPKTLNRRVPSDFRFATDDELDAIEAFLRWLGRRPVNAPPADPERPANREFNILPTAVTPGLTFKDARVREGLAIFISDEASCNSCHRNGGAHFNLSRFGDPPGTNFNSLTDVDEDRAKVSFVTKVIVPKDEGGENTPGFGPTSFGAFNIQPLIEAPRKKSFFHLGAETDFEKALAFYFREPFISSAEIDPEHCRDTVCLETTFGPKPLERLGAFLRSLSAFYSLRDCERLIGETIERIDLGAPQNLPALHCRFALDDVQSVLDTAKITPRPFPAVSSAVQGLKKRLQAAATYKDKPALQQLLTEVAALRSQVATLELAP